MNVMNLGPRELVRGLLSWKGLLAVAGLLQFLLHLPARASAYVPELPGLIADIRGPIKTISLIALAGALIQIAVTLVRRPKVEVAEIPDVDELRPILENLTKAERTVVKWYLEGDNSMRAQYLNYGDPGVKRLADSGILSQFSLSGSMDKTLPFLLKDWVPGYLKKRPELVE